jgi:CRP-like cAMP-binding protein
MTPQGRNLTVRHVLPGDFFGEEALTDGERAEAAEFLNESMGLSVPAEDVSHLDSRTEGWIVGLQMLALSLQGRKDISRFIGSLVVPLSSSVRRRAADTFAKRVSRPSSPLTRKSKQLVC